MSWRRAGSVGHARSPSCRFPGSRSIVGDHRGARGNGVDDERAQRGGRRVRDDAHAASAEPFGVLDLHSHYDQRLLALGSPAGQAGFLTTDVGLIHLDGAAQQLPAGAHQHRPQPVQHRPRCLVRADLHGALQPQRGDAVLSRGERPHRLKPHRQRRAGPIEDRARCHRRPMRAPGALPPPVRNPPPTHVAALVADEPLGPAQPLQIVSAIRVRGEPRQELTHRPRVVPAAS